MPATDHWAQTPALPPDTHVALVTLPNPSSLQGPNLCTGAPGYIPTATVLSGCGSVWAAWAWPRLLHDSCQPPRLAPRPVARAVAHLWEVSTTAQPRRASCMIVFHRNRLEQGSIPELGSS